MATKDPMPGDEVTVHHEHGHVKKKKKHKVVSVHYGPYYGLHGGGFAPAHSCSTDPDHDGDNDTASPDGPGGTESEFPIVNFWDEVSKLLKRNR